jgi:HPt (histidine-containing phosphotransfer) domain-containing protein
MNDQQKQRFAPALQRLAEDEEMLATMARMAVEDGPVILGDLETQVQQGSLTEAAKTAHKLKGVLSTFETDEPVCALQTLIESARRGDLDEVSELHAGLHPKLLALLGEIKAIA